MLFHADYPAYAKVSFQELLYIYHRTDRDLSGDYLYAYMRLFIAAEIPMEIREKLSRASASLRVPGIRLIGSGNMHFTLAFIGELEESRLGDTVSAIDRAEVSPFEIEVAGMGCFGDGKVIYVQAARGREEVARLAMSIRSELALMGINFDRREFVPHVTVARITGGLGGQALQRAVKGFEGSVFGSFTLSGVSLFRSVPAKGSAAYMRLYERKA